MIPSPPGSEVPEASTLYFRVQWLNREGTWDTSYDMSELDTQRWQQRLVRFEFKFKQLEQACEQKIFSDSELQGFVNLFNFSFELAWKTLQDLLLSEGIEAKSPRDVFKESFKKGYLTHPEAWLKMLEKRNLLTHSYSDEIAKPAVSLIKETFYPLLNEVFSTLKNLPSTD